LYRPASWGPREVTSYNSPIVGGEDGGSPRPEYQDVEDSSKNRPKDESYQGRGGGGGGGGGGGRGGRGGAGGGGWRVGVLALFTSRVEKLKPLRRANNHLGGERKKSLGPGTALRRGFSLGKKKKKKEKEGDEGAQGKPGSKTAQKGNRSGIRTR